MIQNEHNETINQNEINEDIGEENDLTNDVEIRTNIVERNYASVESDMETGLNVAAPVNTLSVPAEWCPNKTNPFHVCTSYCEERWTPKQHKGLDEAFLGKKSKHSKSCCSLTMVLTITMLKFRLFVKHT